MALKQAVQPKPVAYRYGEASCNLPMARSPKIKCVLCGRTGAETIINYEARTHHHAKLECLDRKSCNRVRRRNKRGNE